MVSKFLAAKKNLLSRKWGLHLIALGLAGEAPLGGTVAPDRATEKGPLFSRLRIALGWVNTLSVIAARCHLPPRGGSLLPQFLSFTHFRQFATLTDTFPKGQASLIAFL